MAELLKEIEREGKEVLKGAFRLIPRSRPVPAGSIERSKIRRILVVRLDNRLGNLLLITPFLSALRGCFSDATIDLLVSRAFPEVFDGNPDVDRLIVADKAGFIHRPWRTVRFLSDLRSESYDLSFDMSSSHSFSVSSASLVRLVSSTFRVGYRRGESDRFMNVLIPPPADSLHEAEIHLGLLQGIAPSVTIAPPRQGPGLKYFMSQGEMAVGRDLVRAIGLREGPMIGIFIGARGEKAWGDRNFLEVARRLARDCPVLIMGGEREKERLDAVALEAGATAAPSAAAGSDRRPGSNVWVAPVLPLRRFAALVKQCALFISGDCGPMHLASALGVRVLAIFTVGNQDRYGPLGGENRVICDPDRRSVASVLEAARGMIAGIQVAAGT